MGSTQEHKVEVKRLFMVNIDVDLFLNITHFRSERPILTCHAGEVLFYISDCDDEYSRFLVSNCVYEIEKMRFVNTQRLNWITAV